MFQMLNKRFVLFIFLQIFVVIAPLAMEGKLAIVVDDIGYRNREDQAIYEMPKEVNVAIIPSAPHATERAKQAFAQQRNILIHLPMQPQNSAQKIESGALFVGMGQEKIDRLITSSKTQVPYAIGLNNHMGSKATTDSETMQYLMQSLKKHQLFFLDSKTAGNSVAAKIAKEMGIKALERHIFLDNSDELVDVQGQFQAAVQYARKNGVAIVIGHPRKNTIEVLRKGIANLPQDIQLVSLLSLWKNEQYEPIKPYIMLFNIEPALTSLSPFESIPLLRGVPKE